MIKFLDFLMVNSYLCNNFAHEKKNLHKIITIRRSFITEANPVYPQIKLRKRKKEIYHRLMQVT